MSLDQEEAQKWLQNSQGPAPAAPPAPPANAAPDWSHLGTPSANATYNDPTTRGTNDMPAPKGGPVVDLAHHQLMGGAVPTDILKHGIIPAPQTPGAPPPPGAPGPTPIAPQPPSLLPMPSAPHAAFQDTRRPGDVKADEHLFNAEQEAAKQASIDQRLQAQQALELAKQQETQKMAQNVEAQHAQELAQQARDTAQAHFQDAQRAADHAQVDPNHYWAERGTGSRIMATLGMALGAFGASLGHTNNTALDMINADIDRDIKAQEGMVNSKHQAAQTALGQFKDQTGDLNQAKELARISGQQAAIAQLDSLGAQGKDSQIRAQLEQNLLQNQANYQKMVEAKQQRVMLGGAAAGAPNLNQADIQKRMFKDPVTGQTIIASSEKVRDELAEKAAALLKGKQSLQGLATTEEKRGWLERLGGSVAGVFGSGAFGNADIATKKQQAHEAIHDFEHAGGKPERDGERQQVEDAYMGKPNAIFDPHAEMPRNAYQGMQQKYLDMLAAQAPLQGATGFTRDARGNLVPVAGYTGEGVGPQNLGQDIKGFGKPQ